MWFGWLQFQQITVRFPRVAVLFSDALFFSDLKWVCCDIFEDVDGFCKYANSGSITLTIGLEQGRYLFLNAQASSIFLHKDPSSETVLMSDKANCFT